MRGAEGVFVFVAIETKATFGLIWGHQGWGNVRQLLLSWLQPSTPQLGDVQLLWHLNGHICRWNGREVVTWGIPGPAGRLCRPVQALPLAWAVTPICPKGVKRAGARARPGAVPAVTQDELLWLRGPGFQGKPAALKVQPRTCQT